LEPEGAGWPQAIGAEFCLGLTVAVIAQRADAQQSPETKCA